MGEQQQEELTVTNVQDRVKLILELDRTDADPEAAHQLQDALFVEVLRAVAAGRPEAQAMAREVLRVEESDGTRWYA